MGREGRSQKGSTTLCTKVIIEFPILAIRVVVDLHSSHALFALVEPAHPNGELVKECDMAAVP